MIVFNRYGVLANCVEPLVSLCISMWLFLGCLSCVHERTVGEDIQTTNNTELGVSDILPDTLGCARIDWVDRKWIILDGRLGETYEGIFVFSNVGASPLYIGRVSANSDDIRLEISSVETPRGESDTIFVDYVPECRGEFLHTINMIANTIPLENRIFIQSSIK